MLRGEGAPDQHAQAGAPGHEGLRTDAADLRAPAADARQGQEKKLSKRTGDTSLQDYRDKGYPPEAVQNFLSLQGWALDDKTTVFTLAQLVERFDPHHVSPSGSIFDPEKFLWMAGEYVRLDSVERLAERCLPFVVQAGLASAAELAARREWYHAVVASEKERIKLYSELPARIAYLFARDDDVAYRETRETAAVKHAGRVDTLTRYLAWVAPRLRAARGPRACARPRGSG